MVVATPKAGSQIVDTQGRTGIAEFDPNTGMPLAGASAFNPNTGTAIPVGTVATSSTPAKVSQITPQNVTTPGSGAATTDPSTVAPATSTPQPGSPTIQPTTQPSTTQPSTAPSGSTVPISPTAAKYQATFNAGAPSGANLDSSGSARAAVDAVSTAVAPPLPNNNPDVTQTVNDHVAAVQSDVANLTSYESTMQSVTSYQNEIASALGIPDLQAEDMNIKNVMNGSEDDIRSEISSTGGFATESQVEALTATRNKVLIKQATDIENSLSNAQNSLSMAVSSFSADQTTAVSSLKDKINNDSTVLGIYQGIQSNNISNAKWMVSQMGYTQYAATLNAADPTGATTAAAETYLNLPTGTLTNPDALSELDTYREQSLSNANTRLQQTYGLTADQIDSLGGGDSGIQANDGGSFASFPSMEAGMQAAQSLLTSSSYSELSVNDALQKWSGGGYGSEITKIPGTATISSLSPDQITTLLGDMTTAEGGQSAAGYRVNNPLDIKYVASSTPAIGTTGSSTINTSSPGYTSAIVGQTGITQARIDQLALQAATGQNLTTRGGLNKFALNAINNRSAELNSGGNISTNKAQLTALSTSLTAQTTYKNNIQQSLNKAEGGFNQLMTAFSGSGIDPSESTVQNSTVNKIAANLTGGQLFAYNAGLQEISADYAQVFSRNGVTSVATQTKATDILNGNISFKDLAQVQTELKAQGDIAVSSASDQITSLTGQINNIVSPGAEPASTADVSFGNGTLSFYGQETAVGGSFTINGTSFTVMSNGNLKGSDGKTYQTGPDGELQLAQ